MLEKMLVPSPSKDISKSDFLRWKADPITKLLEDNLIRALLVQMSEDLPESIDHSIPIMWQREGSRKMLDIVLDWKPESVADELLGEEA